jgi:hypothetical protein
MTDRLLNAQLINPTGKHISNQVASCILEPQGTATCCYMSEVPHVAVLGTPLSTAASKSKPWAEGASVFNDVTATLLVKQQDQDTVQRPAQHAEAPAAAAEASSASSRATSSSNTASSLGRYNHTNMHRFRCTRLVTHGSGPTHGCPVGSSTQCLWLYSVEAHNMLARSARAGRPACALM